MNVFFPGWFAIVTGIALDGGDCVYVADFYNHRFQRWHSETEEISHGAVSLRIDPIHHPISQMTVRIAFVRQFPALEWDPCSISAPDTIPPTVTSLGKQKL